MLDYCTLEFDRLGPLGEGAITFRPFTILMGPNGSGKSYVAHCLAALDEFLRPLMADFSGLAALAREAPPSGPHSHVEFSKADLLKWVDASFSSMLPKYFRDDQLLARGMSVGLPHASLRETVEVDVLWGDPPPQIVTSTPNTAGHPINVEVRGISGPVKNLAPATSRDGTAGPADFGVSVDRSLITRLTGRSTDDLQLGGPGSAAKLLASALVHFCLGIQSGLSPVHYLPSSRSGLMVVFRQLLDLALQDYFGGAVGAFKAPEKPPASTPLTYATVGFLRRLASVSPKTTGRLADVADYLERDLLHGRCVAESSNGSPPQFRFCPDGTDRSLQFHVTCSGATELFPLVMFLRHVIGREDAGVGNPARDVLVLEEPEAHLHMGAQRILARALAMAVCRGLKVVVTTHSDVFMQEVNNLIKASVVGKTEAGQQSLLNVGLLAEQVIDPESVAAYCLRRTDDAVFVPDRLDVTARGVPLKPMLEVIREQCTLSSGLLHLLGDDETDD